MKIFDANETCKNFFTKNLACPRWLWGLPKWLKMQWSV